MKEIGLHFKYLREKNGLSVEEVSNDLMIDREELENFENANVSFFDDIFKIKEIIELVSKYFSESEDEMIAKFNSFLYDYTSRIPLSEVEKVANENIEKKEETIVASPYTVYKEKKKNGLLKIFLSFLAVILIYILLMI